jgi:UDP-perosamine 4-acetyltransferase
MSRRAVIIGRGGQARVIASFLPHSQIRHLVEGDPGRGDILQSDYFAGEPDREADHYVAIGDNRIRRLYFDRLKRIGVTPASCIGPNAWIARTAVLGEGVFVGAGAVVGAGVRIGDNAMVNNLSLVDHDSVLGEDSQVTVGCMLGAELVVGRRCFFAMKCCVVSRLEVGDDAFVMAGAVVVKNVPAGARVGGVPAQIRSA